MSKAGVDRSVGDIARWTDLQCVRHLATIRWGSYKSVVCPHCNTGSEHYWRTKELRWKCKHCGSCFSVTSDTVYASRRLSLQSLLGSIFIWATGAAGMPAFQLRRLEAHAGYNTSFTLVSKLREGLLRGFNTGLISGVIEMDAAHASGKGASGKRGVPQNFKTAEQKDALLDSALLTAEARRKARVKANADALAAGGIHHAGQNHVFPAGRRMAFSVRKRSGIRGKGSEITRVGVGLTESPDVVKSLVDAYVVAPESILSTDTGTAFLKEGKNFMQHQQVNHSEALVGPDGQHSNNAESFTARMDRAEMGVYLCIEPKYLTDYLAETAFREDFRSSAAGARADAATRFSLSVGKSQYFRGYTHGKHRNFELLLPENRLAAPSGPKKGRSPIDGENGRPPR